MVEQSTFKKLHILKKIIIILFLLFNIYQLKAQHINNIDVNVNIDSVSISITFYNMCYFYNQEYFYLDKREIKLISYYSIIELKTQLKWALKNVKKNTCGRFGRFGLKMNTNQIYLYDDFGFTTLSIKDAKQLNTIIKKTL